MKTIQFLGNALSPSKLICVGRNYVAHAQELGNEIPQNPVIFIKPNSAITRVLKAEHAQEALHYESEICFVIKDQSIAGVGIGLDLTKRATQQSLKEKGLPWERAKAFDGSAVLSEFISMDGVDLDLLSISLHIDGELAQQGGVDMMIFPPWSLLTELVGFLSLEDGDVLMTGTPAGVGPVAKGSVYSVAIHNKGTPILSAEWTAL